MASMRRRTSSTLTMDPAPGRSFLGYDGYAHGVGCMRARGMRPSEELRGRVDHGRPRIRLGAQVTDDEKDLAEFLLGLHVARKPGPQHLRALVVGRFELGRGRLADRRVRLVDEP